MDTEDLEPQKACSKCAKVLPFSQFNSDKTKADGKETRCRECRRAYKRQHHAEHRSGNVTTLRSRNRTPEEEKIARANVAALKRLVENHREEFQHLTAMERRRLGVPVAKKWMAVS